MPTAREVIEDVWIPSRPITSRPITSLRVGLGATAILRALDAAGYVVAPKEPTPAMIEAGERAVMHAGSGDFPLRGHVTYAAALSAVEVRDTYRAMLAASQQKGGRDE